MFRHKKNPFSLYVIHYTRVKQTLKTIGMSDTNASVITTRLQP